MQFVAGAHLQQLRSSQQQLTEAGVAPTDAVSGLQTICPNIAILMLADIRLGFDDLQSLSQLRQLQYLHLQNIPCTRETFLRSTSASPHNHVFAHLIQLTTLVLSQTKNVIKYQYRTEDLHGLSHLTNLSSLAVKTFLPRLWPADKALAGATTTSGRAYLARISNAYIEPVGPCEKLAKLPHLTSLQLSMRPPSLGLMSKLQKLRLDCVTKEDIPANFSGLHSLTELSMGMPDVSPAHMAFVSKFPALLTLTIECWSRRELPSSFFRAFAPDRVPNIDFFWQSLQKLSSIRQLKLLGVEHGNKMFMTLGQMQQLTVVTLSLRCSEFEANQDNDLSGFVALCHLKRLTVTEYDDHELGKLYNTKQAPLYVALQRRFPAQFLTDLQVLLPHTKLNTLDTLDQQIETRVVRSKVAVAPAAVDDRSSDVRFYPLHSLRKGSSIYCMSCCDVDYCAEFQVESHEYICVVAHIVGAPDCKYDSLHA